MKRILSFLIAITMIVPLFGQFVIGASDELNYTKSAGGTIASGECGDDLTWTLYDDGELVISGTGDMWDCDLLFDKPWYNYDAQIQSVTIKNGVTSIGDRCFYYCTSLTSVTIPESVTSIDYYAFAYCTSLTDIYYLSTDIAWEAITKDSTWDFYASTQVGGQYSLQFAATVVASGECGNTLTWTFYDNGELIINGMGDMWDWNDISDIPWYSYSSQIKALTISDDVTSIGNYAFYSCTNLTKVAIGDSVSTIGNYAFYGCVSLTSMDIPYGVKIINDYAFCECTSLTNVTIGDSVTTIGDHAFSACIGLTNVIIPDSVTIIGDYAFSSCYAMTNAVIGDNVTNIGQQAFGFNYSLESLIIGESVNDIGEYAFTYCTHLKSVHIPPNVTNIGRGAFGNCGSLNTVIFDGNVPTIGSDAFYNCANLASVNTPCNWSNTYNFGITVNKFHNWSFAADDNNDIITGTCGNNCATKTVTATLTAPGNLTYDGCQKEVAVEYSVEDVLKAELSYVGDRTNVSDKGFAATMAFGDKSVSKEFAITAKSLTIVADTQAIQYGDEVPELTYKANGLVGDDRLTGTLVTTATDSSDVGEYDITQGTLCAGDNYIVSFTGAKLSITATSQTAPPAPNETAKTSTTVELSAVDAIGFGNVQYACSITEEAPETGWQTSTVFSDLTKNTTYYFFARYAGDGNHNPAVGPSTEITTLNTYTITYDLNDGVGTVPAAQTQDSGTAFVTASDEGFSRTGYSFLGWSKDENASAAEYIGGETVSDIMADDTLYAVWKSNTISVTGVALNKTAATIDVGDTLNLTVTVSPSNATNKEVTWTSSVPSVATVTNGIVTGLTAGTTTITATTVDGSKTATCVVSIAKKPSGGIIYIPTYYDITVNATEGGKVTVSDTSVVAKTDVSLIITPDEGYTFESIEVVDKSGKKIEGSVFDDRFIFKMPASDVTVTATFKKIETPVNPDPVDPDPVNPDPVVPSFSDVAKDTYYFDAVEWAVKNGVTTGTSDTTFSPDMTCTRAQAVTFLWRAAGSPESKSTEMPFEDVATEAYYYDAVLWAVENGITNGTSATTFSPDADCTRAQIVTFLWRAQKSPALGNDNPFNDVKADAYYVNAVLWAVEEKITNGTSDTTFSPDADCTRAQIVTFLYRAMGDEK